MSRGAQLTLMGLTVLFAACGRDADPNQEAQARPAGIAWHQGSVEKAFEVAQAEGKSLLVYWSAEWCPYCKALESTVFTRPDFIEQSRRAISVKLDGDDPEGQKWGTQFGVVGYPTLLVFRSDGVETARVSGGMDLEQYAATVARSFYDRRPILEVLSAAVAPVGAVDTSVISAGDCRRLAYHGWDLDRDAETPPPERAAELELASNRCPLSESVAGFRLAAHALAQRLARESESIHGGKGASAEMRADVTSLMPQLSRPDEVRGAADVLAAFDDALYAVAKSEGAPFASEFEAAWTSAMLTVAHDVRFGESERLITLATALDGVKHMRGKDAMPPELVEQARSQVATALAAGGQGGNRHDIVNAARVVYTVLGDDEALRALMLDEIPKSATPYYYMPVLAQIEERQGNKAEALSWLRRAYEATRTPGARARWGSGYVRGLTRMAPDDVAEIETAALGVAQAYNERDALTTERSPERAGRLLEPLKTWATNDKKQAVVVRVEKRLTAS